MPTDVIDPARELRAAIDQLSPRTRLAMLEAVRCPATPIIAGGYVARGGGVCPLLAAHRRGGRTHDDSVGASTFAGVWDRFTGTRTGEPRAIDETDRRALETMLAESVARRVDEPRRADRAPKLRVPARLAWIGVFHTYDDYRTALAAAGENGAPPPPGESERVLTRV